jgi:hypothetical protein
MVSASKKLKERSVYIYLPSTKMADEWKARAQKQDLSISKFVVEHVLDSLRQEEEVEASNVSKVDLATQLRETQEELKKVAKEAALYRQLSEKLDNELRYYRTRPFMEENFQGIRSYDKHLVDLLKRKGTVDSDRLLEDLDVDPRQTDLVKGIRAQLDNLEAYGLIESTPRGWKWVEKDQKSEEEVQAKN